MHPSTLRLRKDLTVPPKQPQFPAGIQPVSFVAAKHARAVWELLELAYRSGGGCVTNFDKWWPALACDPEYDPATIFAATDTTGKLVGIALCWRLPFVKDLAVAPQWRMQGLGEALLQQAFVHFHQRGDVSIDLKVYANNPAVRLYRRVGMLMVP